MLDASNTGERIVAVGARGLIAYSDDDAQTWQQASVPVSLTLTSVFFANPTIGLGHRA